MFPNTPKAGNKRHNSDMLFSPKEEGTASNKEDLKTLLSDTLEEKFQNYIQPLQNEIKHLRQTIEVQEKERQAKDAAVDTEIEQLKTENSYLKEHMQKLENFQRKNNIRIFWNSRTQG